MSRVQANVCTAVERYATHKEKMQESKEEMVSVWIDR